MNDAILIERLGDIVIWRLNRPDLRNAISDLEMIDALVAAADRAQNDRTVRVVILTGNGTAFSSGGNVKSIRAELTDSDMTPSQLADWYLKGIQRIPLALYRLDVPIIAAVNGPAIGAGCDLACMCDIRIAAESARFAESFVKLGLIPGDGGGWLLPRTVGMSKACEMAFTGDQLDSGEALACGLVSKVVPDDQLMAEAMKVAQRIAVNPPISVRMTKQLIREGQRMELDTHLQLAAVAQATVQRTNDHVEAMAAIFEKRDPVFLAR